MDPLTQSQKHPSDGQLASLNSNTLTDGARHGFIPQARHIIKTFKLSTRPFSFNLALDERAGHEEIPRYYAVTSQFGPGRPDVSLHAGKDRHGNQLAVAYFRFSRHIRMGFGSEAIGMTDEFWEQMKNTSDHLGHARYEFEYNVPTDTSAFINNIPSTSARTRTKFVWERTRDPVDGVEGFMEQHLGWRNYRLTEQGSGQVVAIMLIDMCTGVWYKGELHICKNLPKEMEIVVAITATCIMEKGERRVGRYTFGPLHDTGSET